MGLNRHQTASSMKMGTQSCESSSCGELRSFRIFGTVGLGVSRPHEWSVLLSGSSFSYLHHIGDMRYATILWYFVIWPCSRHGIWPWRFGSNLSYICGLPTCYLLFIRFHSCRAIPFVCPARPHLYIYLVLQVYAKHGSW